MYMPFLGGFLRVSVFAPAAFWLLAASEGFLPFLCIAAAALAHEAGHAAAIKLAGSRVTRVTVYPFGGLIECTAAPDTKSAVLIQAGGIAANAACAFVFACVFALTNSACVLMFVFASLFFALTNLVPLRTSDGGRMLYIAAESRSGAERAETICRIAAVLGRAALAAAALYILYLSDYNNGLCVILLIAAMPK